MYELITFNVQEHVATITLNRPKAGNTINLELATELHQAVDDIATNESVRAVLLTGNGPNFCFGGDLKAFLAAGDEIEAYIKDSAHQLHTALAKLSRGNAPVVASVSGMVAGAGVSFCAMADFVVTTKSSRFTMAYTRAGLSPDASSSYFLPRRIGDRRAREMMLTNRLLNAQEALDWGLVNRVVDDESVTAEALAIAQELALGPVQAFGAVKQLLDAAYHNDLEAQLQLEADLIAQQAMSAEGQEGMDAAMNKRAPSYI